MAVYCILWGNGYLTLDQIGMGIKCNCVPEHPIWIPLVELYAEC
uniref:Uncharacterized protein n=1 Tax=Nymphaea colorata TaxID=210225 RepID=A0A5K1HZZ8_9MAGN|nr:unnamed protein product [Nymphaea colorata]